MEITLNSLLQAKDIIQDLSKLKMKAKTTWQLLKIAKKLEEEFVEFEKIRTDKIKEYGTENEDGSFGVAPESENYFRLIGELNEVLATPITLDIQRIPLSELEDLEIDIMELFKIEWLIQE